VFLFSVSVSVWVCKPAQSIYYDPTSIVKHPKVLRGGYVKELDQKIKYLLIIINLKKNIYIKNIYFYVKYKHALPKKAKKGRAT